VPLAHVDLLYSARRRCAAVRTSDIASPQQSLVGAAVNGWVGWIPAIPSDAKCDELQDVCSCVYG
jgi:hypothetical protein